jgi:hypothetical protein
MIAIYIAAALIVGATFSVCWREIARLAVVLMLLAVVQPEMADAAGVTTPCSTGAAPHGPFIVLSAFRPHAFRQPWLYHTPLGLGSPRPKCLNSRLGGPPTFAPLASAL